MKLNDWYKNRIQQNQPVAKKEAEIDIPISTRQLLDSYANLVKAMKDDDIKHIEKFHNESFVNEVNPTYHAVNSEQPHPSYKKLIESSKETPALSGIKGVSPKLVHKTGKDYFMTRPYHSTSRDLPLAGWSVMTTKNLYNAGNIGHLVEDVRMHKLGDMDVTSHKFSSDHKPASEFPGGMKWKTQVQEAPKTKLVNETPTSPSLDNSLDPSGNFTFENKSNINPFHARLIGTMDYLTGNMDRHADNLFVSKNPDKNGQRSLLAIDHDRSFIYPHHDSPSGSYEMSAISRHMGDDALINNRPEDKQLADWWDSNKIHIYDEMNRNLQSIKNEDIRGYLRRNFDQRFQTVSTWAKEHPQHGHGLFHRNNPSTQLLEPSPYISIHHDNAIESLKQKLNLPENNPIESLDLIAKEMNSKDSNNFRPQYVIAEATANRVANGMNADQLVKYFSRFDDDPAHKRIKNEILMKLKEDPKANREKLDKLIQINHSLPPDSRILNPFWESHILDKIKGK